MKTRLFMALSTALLLVSTSVLAQSWTPRASEFCAACQDSTSAQQKAWTFKPAVHCDWPGGQPELPIPPDLECWSKDREVLLVNPHTNQVFSYRLVFDRDTNRHALKDWQLSSDQAGAVDAILDIYHALMSADFGHQVQGHEVITYGTRRLNDGSDCPEGTALDHVLRPELRQWMFSEVEDQWLDVMQVFRQREPGVSRSVGISASVGPVRLSVGWEDNQPPNNEIFRARFVFPNSEVPTSAPFLDVIVFEVHEFDFGMQSILMDMEYVEDLSRAAGKQVPQLLSGQTVIENACVQQKLDEYQDATPVEFRVGGPGGQRFDFPPTNPGDNLCTKRLCATVCVDGSCQCQFEVVVLTLCE